MGWTEFPSELVAEIFPVNKLCLALVLQLLLPTEYLRSPLLCLAGLHVRHSPHNLSLLISEFFRAESDVNLTGVQECQALGAISIKVEWGSWSDLPGFGRVLGFWWYIPKFGWNWESWFGCGWQSGNKSIKFLLCICFLF